VGNSYILKNSGFVVLDCTDLVSFTSLSPRDTYHAILNLKNGTVVIAIVRSYLNVGARQVREPAAHEGGRLQVLSLEDIEPHHALGLLAHGPAEYAVLLVVAGIFHTHADYGLQQSHLFHRIPAKTQKKWHNIY